MGSEITVTEPASQIELVTQNLFVPVCSARSPFGHRTESFASSGYSGQIELAKGSQEPSNAASFLAVWCPTSSYNLFSCVRARSHGLSLLVGGADLVSVLPHSAGFTPAELSVP